MLIADGERAIIGSINIAPGSFDDRRELAIEVHDEDIIKRLHTVAQGDWENSHPLDLSDEGLLEDLKGSAKNLALDVDHKLAKKHKAADKDQVKKHKDAEGDNGKDHSKE